MNLEQLLNRKFAFLRDSLVTRSCKLVTPSDTEDLQYEGFIIVLGVAGDVKVQTSSGDIVTLPLETKEIIPLVIKKVFSTGTDATNIYVLR
jgi:hypothetical protein